MLECTGGEGELQGVVAAQDPVVRLDAIRRAIQQAPVGIDEGVGRIEVDVREQFAELGLGVDVT